MPNKRSRGRLRHRITIKDPTPSQSNSGHPAESPAAISNGSDLPANVYDVGGGEPLRDQQVEAHITTIVEMNYLSGVKPEYHVTYGSRRLEIMKALDRDGRQRKLELHCRELAN